MAAIEGALATPRAQSDAALVAFAVVSLVWLGVLLGVSFLATPVKFLAPSLTLPVALDVGRQTFHWLNRVEVVLGAAALAAALAHEIPRFRHRAADGSETSGGSLAEPSAHAAAGSSARASSADVVDRRVGPPYAILLAGFLLVIVALQALWLLPLLDARVEVIIHGGTPPPSLLHDAYVIVEAAKLGALVGAGWLGIASLRRYPRLER